MKRNDLLFSFFVGIGVGAGLMYIFDPNKGQERRALASNQATDLINTAQEKIGEVSQDISNRVKEKVTDLSNIVKGETVEDSVLFDSIKSKLGHVVSNIRDIEVKVKDGYVTLLGNILEQEQDALINTILSITGVVDVDNQLKVGEQTKQSAKGAGSTNK